MGLISETRMTNFINISSSRISIVQLDPVIVQHRGFISKYFNFTLISRYNDRHGCHPSI